MSIVIAFVHEGSPDPANGFDGRFNNPDGVGAWAIFSAVRVLGIALLALAAGCGVRAAPVAFANPVGPYHERARVVVVGDLQRTGIVEFWREHNNHEREVIVSEIARVNPDLLAITGDCVFDGGSDAEWATFDDSVAPLHLRGIPTIAAFGNHEYWRGAADAETHFFPRFPLDAHRHWFTVAFGPLRIVVLDGNRDELTTSEWQSQLTWYARELEALDDDATARGVLVMLHQPPYTNSTVTSDDEDVQRDIVPPMLCAKKTMAMLNGHTHSYERYERRGKVFVVSGGGGGPRARLETGTDRRHRDNLFDGPALRDFHYTVYTLTQAGVEAEVRGVPKGGAATNAIHRFSMPWPG